MDKPFLDVKNADAFEQPTVFCRAFPDLSHSIAVCLVKLKMLLDLIAVKEAGPSTAKKLLAELQEIVKAHVARSPIISGKKGLLESSEKREAAIKKLKQQLKLIYNSIKKQNPYYWPGLWVDAEGYVDARPMSYSRGSEEEVEHVFKFSYDAWLETAGALSAMKHLSKNGFA